MPSPDERDGRRFIARHQDPVAECFRGLSHLGREDQVATYQEPDCARFGRRPFGRENRPRINMGRYDVDHQQAANRCELLGTDVNVSGYERACVAGERHNCTQLELMMRSL
jgi:hypothetical protein